MFSLPLLKRNLLQMIKPIVIFVSILAMYEVVIVYMYEPDLMNMLNEYQNLMPEMMAAMGMGGMATNLLEFMNIYLYGFLIQIVPLIFTIVVGNSLLMKYVDSGSLANLLSTGNSRLKIVFTQFISFVIGIILVVSSSAIIGGVSAQIMFPDELSMKPYIILNIVTILLHLAIGSIVFCSACVFNDSKYYYAVGAGVPLTFYLITMLANMGGKLEKLKYLSIFSLLPAQKIVSTNEGYGLEILALVAITVVLYGFGIVFFTKKDFSI